jgi:hypothetical protein
MLEAYRLENAQLMRATSELQRQAAEREEALRGLRERVRVLETTRSGQSAGRKKGG